MPEVEAYPLTWPGGWRRTKREDRTTSRFGRRVSDAALGYRPIRKLTLAGARDLLMAELRHAADDENAIVISTNIPVRNDGLPRSGSSPKRDDPGVAVYFRVNGRDVAMACDKFFEVPDNLAAIAKTLEAMRSIKRWGAHELLDRAFHGFQALPPGTPPPPEERPWWEVLNLPKEVASLKDGAGRRLIKLSRDALAMQFHPDKTTGDIEKMAEVNRAYEEALKEVRA